MTCHCPRLLARECSRQAQRASPSSWRCGPVSGEDSGSELGNNTITLCSVEQAAPPIFLPPPQLQPRPTSIPSDNALSMGRGGAASYVGLTCQEKDNNRQLALSQKCQRWNTLSPQRFVEPPWKAEMFDALSGRTGLLRWMSRIKKPLYKVDLFDEPV